MTNPNTTVATAKWTETGAERLVRISLEMREQRIAAQRDDLQQLVLDGRLTAKAAGFAALLSKIGLSVRQLSELATTVWELLGAYAM